MTPYELRFEIFKQAQSLIDSEYFAKRSICELLTEKATTIEGLQDYLNFPAYPSFEDIEKTAEKINRFVSGK